MISREVVDFFSYDALCHDHLRKILFGRKVQGRSAFVDDYQLRVIGELHYTLLEGKGITIGEIITLNLKEQNLAWQFYNQPNGRYSFEYDFVRIQAKSTDPANRRGGEIQTEALTPIIHVTPSLLNELSPRATIGTTVSKKEILAMCRAARVVRARYLAQAV